jgi:hypothetical protein
VKRQRNQRKSGSVSESAGQEDAVAGDGSERTLSVKSCRPASDMFAKM